MLAAVSSRAFDFFSSPFSLWNVRTFFGGSPLTSSLLSHARLSASTLASCLAGISSPPSLTCRPARSRSSKCVSSTQMTRILYPQMISRSMASRKESLCTIRPWTCSSSMEDTGGGASSSSSGSARGLAVSVAGVVGATSCNSSVVGDIGWSARIAACAAAAASSSSLRLSRSFLLRSTMRRRSLTKFWSSCNPSRSAACVGTTPSPQR